MRRAAALVLLATAGCTASFVETDIADYHFYAAFPDNRRSWDAFVDELGSRSSWLFSQEGDAVIKGDEPVMCSEFGNWGLPNPRDLAGADREVVVGRLEERLRSVAPHDGAGRELHRLVGEQRRGIAGARSRSVSPTASAAASRS